MKKEYILWGLCGAGVLTAILSVALKKNKTESPTYQEEVRQFNQDRTSISEYAQMLHDAMKDTGTDFNKILKVMSELDENKMKIVSDRFGKRAYYNRLFGLVPTSGGKKLTLKEWFKEELDSSQYKQVKDKYPNLF